MFPSSWLDSWLHIACWMAVIKVQIGRQEQITPAPVLFQSHVQLYTHTHTHTHTHTPHSSRPTGLRVLLPVMDVCYREHPPLMHQEALTCLCQTWLATGFMGFIWLWSADEAVCVRSRKIERERVCVCVSTHLIRWIASRLLNPRHLEPADAVVIKILTRKFKAEATPTCDSAAHRFVPSNDIFHPKTFKCNSVSGWVVWLVWFEYICMQKNSFRDTFHHVPRSFGSAGSLRFFMQWDDWKTYPCVNSLNGIHQLLFLLSGLMCWWWGERRGGRRENVWRIKKEREEKSFDSRKLTAKPISFDSHQWLRLDGVWERNHCLCVCVCVCVCVCAPRGVVPHIFAHTRGQCLQIQQVR